MEKKFIDKDQDRYEGLSNQTIHTIAVPMSSRVRVTRLIIDSTLASDLDRGYSR
jgi:hypothetical protein